MNWTIEETQEKYPPCWEKNLIDIGIIYRRLLTIELSYC
jgi:hypothetical protein